MADFKDKFINAVGIWYRHNMDAFDDVTAFDGILGSLRKAGFDEASILIERKNDFTILISADELGGIKGASLCAEIKLNDLGIVKNTRLVPVQKVAP